VARRRGTLLICGRETRLAKTKTAEGERPNIPSKEGEEEKKGERGLPAIQDKIHKGAKVCTKYWEGDNLRKRGRRECEGEGARRRRNGTEGDGETVRREGKRGQLTRVGRWTSDKQTVQAA
jgi:hypothetical protein